MVKTIILLALPLVVWAPNSVADMLSLTYTLEPEGPIFAEPGSNVLFSLVTNADLPILDNLTADIVPSTFAAPGSQPGYSSVLPGSGFEDSFVIDFLGSDLPAGRYDDIFDLQVLNTAPAGSLIMLDFKTQATGPDGNGLATDVISNTEQIEIAPTTPVPEPSAAILLATAVGFLGLARGLSAFRFRQSTWFRWPTRIC